MPTKNLKLKDLADVGISGYRSLALWSEELVDPDKPRRPGRKIPLDIWDALALSLAARLGGEGCPMKILRVMVDNLKDNDPGFWHRVQSSKGRSLLAFVRERSGEVDSLGIIDPAQESALALAWGGKEVLLIDLFDHARELLERLGKLPREEALDVA